VKQKLFAIVLVSLLTAGCRQGLGDRCQINADCQSGLVCNQAKEGGQCDRTTSNGIDAEPPPFDAATEAAVDAAIDAAIDAP